jgi:photosystem II stability/assembly factor-like uncharacterized protein
MSPLRRFLRVAALAASIAAIASVAPASAAWLPVGGPVAPVLELRLDPGRPELLYARTAASDGTSTYLWRSEDAGATWRDVQAGLEQPISALAIDPEDPRVIWVWTETGELWRSADAGATWQQRPTAASSVAPQALQLLVDPHHPETLYRVDAEDLGPVVSVSRDNGATFTKGAPLSKLLTDLEPVLVRPDRDELLAFVTEGLRVSTDGGRSWSLRGKFRQAGFVRAAVAPSDPDTLYGIPTNTNQCLARSDDGGAHWQSLPYPPRLPSARAACYAVAVDPLDARHLWVAAQIVIDGFSNLLFESKNGGASWSNPVTQPNPGVVAAGGERIYTNSIEAPGLFASSNGGRTWTPAGRGILAGDLRDGLVAQRLPGGGVGRRLVALNTPLNGDADDLYRSDGGQGWSKVPLQPVAIAGAGGSVVLAGDDGGVTRSTDGGTTWSAVPSAPARVQAFLPDVPQPGHAALLAFEDNGAYGNIAPWTSDDAGATWRRSSDGLPIACTHVASVDECPSFPAYAVDPFNPSRRWVAYNLFSGFGLMAGLFVSADGGASWQVATSDLSTALTLALAADPTVPGRLLAGTDQGLFASLDGGLHWSPLGDLPAGAQVRQIARDPLSSSWYAATIASGIYRSLDGGAHWTLLAGAPDHESPTIAVDPRRPTALLAAFAGQGLWRWVP